MAALIQPADAGAEPIRLTCRATLPPGLTVQRRIVFEGAEASGAGLDCNGGSIGRTDRVSTTREPTVAVWSRRNGDGWSVPHDVRIVRCTINGNLRVWGLGRDDIDALRASSRTADHTTRVQASAPTGLRLEDVTFVGAGSIPLYVGPGVGGVRMTGGGFRGRSVSTAVYLDAESQGADIRDVDFDIRTGREQIAIDGSAGNRISGNRFQLRGRGGVFLYRNCGEDGVVRHQSPSGNVISDNRFRGGAWFRPRAVVVGSREGRRRYCGDDAGWPWGSSIDDGDGARGNVVSGNAVRLRWLPDWLQAGRGATRDP
ncbi:MAG: right-handed parallel beta-helix repeat-containing protein [Alphaproteobacteria bacterium]|nr:right-handed parallel beta-helix repeat-containing protein [Alphaproteobacteria bacterium]MBU2378964.1 right-handed parallel beta-helix repeat-containing protein [Alphaproteobacteria bacterium]